MNPDQSLTNLNNARKVANLPYEQHAQLDSDFLVLQGALTELESLRQQVADKQHATEKQPKK